MRTMENKMVNIYLETNPNPNSLKFVANSMLVEGGQSFDFPDKESAKEAPLANELFDYPHVKRVFYMSNFVTVTKSDDVEWMEVQDELKSHIKNYLESGKPILSEVEIDKEPESLGDESEVIQKIKSVLEEYIKPAVEMDGGAIGFDSFDDGVVTVTLQGSCSGCPSSTVTLKAGIENLLKRMLPNDVKSVEAVDI
ncbi:MAG: NifU family protein [Bacteroidetes bacterium]|nr:NifU family protein [Bacteroidota bacterium]MDA1119471.1 NifU family protein [Bacteroidota bacterium]